MAETMNLSEAKAHLSELLAKAEKGEEVYIARGKTPVVRLVPVKPPKTRRPGRLAHWRTRDEDAVLEVDPEQAAIDAGDRTDEVGIR